MDSLTRLHFERIEGQIRSKAETNQNMNPNESFVKITIPVIYEFIMKNLAKKRPRGSH